MIERHAHKKHQRNGKQNHFLEKQGAGGKRLELIHFSLGFKPNFFAAPVEMQKVRYNERDNSQAYFYMQIYTVTDHVPPCD